jgi:hypothetical protein
VTTRDPAPTVQSDDPQIRAGSWLMTMDTNLAPRSKLHGWRAMETTFTANAGRWPL